MRWLCPVISPQASTDFDFAAFAPSGIASIGAINTSPCRHILMPPLSTTAAILLTDYTAEAMVDVKQERFFDAISATCRPSNYGRRWLAGVMRSDLAILKYVWYNVVGYLMCLRPRRNVWQLSSGA